METKYFRNLCNRVLIATIISIDECQTVYTLNWSDTPNEKSNHKELTALFLKSFSILKN